MFDELNQVRGSARRAEFDPSLFSRAGATARAGLGAAGVMFAFVLGACSHAENPPEQAATAAAADATSTAGPAETSAPNSAQTATASRGNGNAANATSTATSTSTSTGGATTTTSSGTTNSVDTLVNDMKLNNDLVLAGVPPERGYAAGPGFVVMGNDPRGTRTPTWWNPANTYYKSSAYWNQIVPWMVIFDGVGNAATNTRVELRNMKAYYKSRSSGQWILLSQGTIDGENYPKGLNTTPAARPDIISLAGGVVSVRPPSTDLHFHGWCCARSLPAPADIAAIHITLQSRLTVHDPSQPDDRSAARYLIQVGGDYYPDSSMSTRAFAPDYWNPGIGLSRSKLVRNTWQSYSFTTLDVAIQDPGGAAITEAELRRAPPPLD